MRMTAPMLSGFLALLVAMPASAAITGFTVNKIDGAGALQGQLDSRMTDDYKINYADCLLYLGDYSDPEAEVPSGAVAPRFSLKWSMTPVTGYDYSIKVGNCSDTGGIADEATESCKYIVSKTSLSSYTNNEIIVSFTDLFLDRCNLGDTGDSSIYIFVQYGDDTLTKMVETVKFSYDFEAPLTPTELSAVGGEGNLKVSWSDDVNSDDVTYKVYWADESFDEDTIDLAKSKSDIDATSYQIGGLSIGTQYYVGIVAVDEYDNESTLSKLVTASPVDVTDFWESYKGAGGQEEGGFCFVATAAWQTPMSGALPLLRGFRDSVLLQNAWGRRFVTLYYSQSPALAAAIKGRPVLRAVTRVALAPLVGVAWYATKATPVERGGVLIALALALTALAWRRRNLISDRRA